MEEHFLPRGTFLTPSLGLCLGDSHAGERQLLPPSVPLELWLFSVSQPQSRLD